MNHEALPSISKLIINEKTKFSDFFIKNPNKKFSSKSVMFGTGLCNSSGILSSFIPFDFVSYMILAIKIHKEFSMNKIIHIIGDQEALTNKSLKSSDIFLLVQKIENFVNLMIKILKINNYEIIHSSSFEKIPEFEEIKLKKELINSAENEYVKSELAVIEYLRKFKDVEIKLSWASDEKSSFSNHLNEEYFDIYYQKIFSDAKNLTFLYCEPGRMFYRFIKCPYICLEKEKDLRILIEDNLENLERKFDEKNKLELKPKKLIIKNKNFMNYYEILCNEFFDVFSIAKPREYDIMTLSKKIHFIINLIKN